MGDDRTTPAFAPSRDTRQPLRGSPALHASAPAFEDSADFDSLDERTPVSVTQPSASLEPMLAPLPESPPVVVMPTIDVGPDPFLSPLPPPSFLDPADGGDAPPSSKPASSGRVAPPMPQIPKPISSRGPVVQAPGIVSTQAIPLTVPAKRTGRSPLFVAIAFALIGGMLALAVALGFRGKKADAASSGEGAPVASSTAAAADPPASAAATSAPPPATTAAASAPAAASATAIVAATASPTAQPALRGTLPKQTTAAAPRSSQPRKSDRIED